jgi:hypothetical protein
MPGNASELTPAYGATELIISVLMSAALYWMLGALKHEARRHSIAWHSIA